MNNTINRRKQTESLYGLRGVGAVIIAFFYHHYHFTTEHNIVFGEKLFWYWFKYGFLFVETFFMISGFVISMNYEKRLMESRISFKDYMWRRISHLYPLFFITLIIATAEHLLYILLTGEEYFLYEKDLFHFILNLFLIHCGWFDQKNSFNGPSWCISIEIFCYMVFYLVILFRRKYHISRLFYIVPVLLGGFSIYHKWDLPVLNVKMGRGICCFFIGVLLFHCWDYYITHREQVRIDFINLFLLFTLALVVLFLHLSGKDWTGKFQLAYIFYISPVLLWLTVTPGPVRLLMRFPFMTAVGKLSMSIYLWNVPVQLLLILCNLGFHLNLDYNSRGFILFNFGVTMLTALVSYLLIEKRSRKISQGVVNFLLHKEA